MKKNLSLLILTFSLLIILPACTTKPTNPTDIVNTGLPWNIRPSVENWQWQEEIQEPTEEIVVYTVQTGDRGENVWEDIRVYDESWDEVFSLIDNDEAQYFFDIQWKYLILDNGTSASQRLVQVYDVQKWEKIFETDYYPWEDDLQLEWNIIRFPQRIDNWDLSDYSTLAICENEYDNGYTTTMEYTLWQTSAKNLKQVKCAYFE